MVILVIGRPDSGKSELAEGLILKLADINPKFYIATMIPFGKEGERRVEKHRKMREGKGFITIECPYNISSLKDKFGEYIFGESKTCEYRSYENKIFKERSGQNMSEEESTASKINILLECMSNLIGNEMHLDSNKDLSDKELVDYILSSVKTLSDLADNMVIVTNEFQLEEGFDQDTIRYVKLVNETNEELCNIADRVYKNIDGEWI
ncbi:MAG: bifunctional adenosylcobinamide kinase/adenosylcobinamide-phosphate guanylyltransferase [Eubacterium sp.]|nr:bifunctional adenosylcobinamide kinase/adenosylcobinamide-phosphate guanylyltransferase [Eubacterium sp.]